MGGFWGVKISWAFRSAADRQRFQQLVFVWFIFQKFDILKSMNTHCILQFCLNQTIGDQVWSCIKYIPPQKPNQIYSGIL